jgi:hypothetical protein
VKQQNIRALELKLRDVKQELQTARATCGND